MDIDLAAKASAHHRGNATGMIGVAVTDDQGFGGRNIDSEQACVVQQRIPRPVSERMRRSPASIHSASPHSPAASKVPAVFSTTAVIFRL
jgi:hypothetical protein